MKESQSKTIQKKTPGKSLLSGTGGSGVPFDLASATKTIARADAIMARLVKTVGPCRLELQQTPGCFESLLESIVYQQLTARAAETILKRVKSLYKNKFPSAGQILGTADEELRAAGLSRAKIIAVKDLSEKTEKGVLPLLSDIAHMEDEEIIEIFSSVRGIGEWSVQMFLIFRLGRPDVMPCKDYGVRKGFARAYNLSGLPAPSEILAQAECWRPYRTVASWYLWRVP